MIAVYSENRKKYVYTMCGAKIVIISTLDYMAISILDWGHLVIQQFIKQ
jgi:hypothetical protein